MIQKISLLMIASALFLVQCQANTPKTNEPQKEEVSTNVASEPTTGLNVGDKAPELVYNNPDGEPIALSSLEGKMVLIDFWAAWCPPCRRENPVIVSVYDEFKEKKFENGDGFTIYSVSLDRTKEQWVQAIEQDKLSWDYHVSDLKYWNSEAAQIYNVRGIPTNFLINGDGIIVAKSLRGENLRATLAELAK